MKLLITGGLGFIGSNFIRYIMNKYPDYKVINYDKMTYAGNPENLRDIEKDPHYKFIRGCVTDENLVNEVIAGEKPDAIIHFAAESHVDRSIHGSLDFIQTNVMGTRVILDAAKNHKIERFIFISTDEVYGDVEVGKSKEEDPFRPNNPYAASKAAADLMARAYFKTFKLPVLIVRSSNNFGPYQYPEKLMPLFITNILEGKRVPLYGDGLNVRNWLYVLDNCSGIDMILHRGKDGEAYNVGGETEKSNREITEIILRELGKDESWIEYVQDRPGHDRRYALDSTKIKKLGWEPKYDFETAIKEKINWYKENIDWWKKIKSGEYLEFYNRHYNNLKINNQS